MHVLVPKLHLRRAGAFINRLVHITLGSNLFVGNSLVDMYAKCGSIEDMQKVFDMMLKHNVVSWSTMILGHVKCGQAPKALKLFQQCNMKGCNPICSSLWVCSMPA